ncbi:glycogen debranching protein GlgX [Oceaniglobus indicus]|uniref:glycogen debranching protein GlgX n=1 Tax=Oceaniglobus indicus TaxID=2047749 RepID=UPI000C1956DB|nr:glycogen debranching protein GlgX [Oceaniglobus indicus]
MNDTTTAPQFDRALGQSHTLGARVRDGGTNFALFSDNATKVELCLFDETGQTELHRLALPETEGGIWHGFLPGIGHGQVYGYRVHGPWAPEDGHRFNPNKLLLDPYARELVGQIEWDDALHGYTVGTDDTVMDDRDSAPFMPKGMVVQDAYEWDQSNALRHRYSDSVIYEAHVKGLTKRHPGVPEEDRGTFAGLASDAMIDHLHRVGVTAIELLPVHAFANDQFLVQKGLSNYWGYNTLSFFAPQQAYLKSGHVAEVQHAVDRFHRAGIEVILDVVYNHTCEGNEMGPTLSYRGIDNASYYLLSEDKRHSFDTTGTGNTLNVAHPMVLRMVLDSLRYWVEVMHVDGFRFDLASTLGREATGFEREGAFFAAIRQDPVLSGVKLIAEPWDIGEGGYQVGGFPWPFREWNDKARDDIRAFWRRDPGLASAMGERLTGSPVQFQHSNRPATSSINFIAAHDGFTTHDTVSYDDKHNDANGEDGNDGHDHNLSHNLGAEGPTDDPAILEARFRRVKGMLATLALCQGTPMILAGDEFGQSQQGNNNAYCQDNELAWLDWDNADEALTDAVAAMLSLRKSMPGYVSSHWAVSEPAEGHNTVTWWHPAGREMTDEDWSDDATACIGMRTRTTAGLDVLAFFNTGDDMVACLPDGAWTRRLDTAQADIACDDAANDRLDIGWQSVVVLTRQDG